MIYWQAAAVLWRRRELFLCLDQLALAEIGILPPCRKRRIIITRYATNASRWPAAIGFDEMRKMGILAMPRPRRPNLNLWYSANQADAANALYFTEELKTATGSIGQTALYDGAVRAYHT